MKNIILILTLISILSCKGQDLNSYNIIPIENEITYRNNETEVPEATYWKDVNNLLDKFVGTWIGTFNGVSYQFLVSKYTYNSTIRVLSRDKLRIKYLITDSDGNIIANTLISGSGISGDYIDINGKTYHLNYIGENFMCGQNGVISITTINNDTQIRFVYAKTDQITSDCTTGLAEQILPPYITLTKQ